MTMPLDLRLLLADAYRDAALSAANMMAATHALEAIRDAGTGDDAAYLAIYELERQLAQVSDTRVVKALNSLAGAISAAKIALDLAAVEQAAERDPAEAWAELRRRFARAIAKFQDVVVDGLARGALSGAREHKSDVERWIAQVQHMVRAHWPEALDLFESLGHDSVVRGSDRAQLLARATQVQLYHMNDLAAAERALADARAALADDSASSTTAMSEVMCAAAQLEIKREQPEKAKQLLQEAMRIDPSFEDAYRYMGEIVAAESTPEEAEKWYVRGMESAPGGMLNLLALAGILGTPENYPSRRLRVAELRERAFRVAWTKRYSLYVDFALIALANNELDDAWKLMELAREEDASRADAFIIAGRVLSAKNRLVEALEEYGRALAAEPTHAEGWDRVRELADRAPDAETARTLLRAIDRIFKGSPRAALLPARLTLLQKAGRWDDAEAESAAVLSEDGDEPAHNKRLARIRNEHGNQIFGEGDYRGATALYESALLATREDAVLWGNLADALEHDADAAGRVERLGRGVTALQHAIAFGGDAPDPAYVKQHPLLAMKYKVASRFGLRVLEYTATKPPLCLEISDDLLPLVIVPDTTKLSEDCLATVDRVRGRVASETGIVLPAVNFRQLASSWEEGQYALQLGDLYVDRGSVPCDRVLMFGAAPPPGAPADRPPATDPLSGEMGYWLTHSDEARVTEPHRVVKAIEYPLLELARAYLRNARTEVTIDDVAGLVERSMLNDATALLENSRFLHRLTMVVRCLLAEGAPVCALQAIADIVLDNAEESVTRMVERARMVPGVRERLRGNEAWREMLELGHPSSKLVRDSLWNDDIEPALALVPKDCEQLLASVRDMVANCHGRPVLVTDADIRPFVRWVLEIEFPDLPVMSRRELPAPRRELDETRPYAQAMEAAR